MGLYCGMLQLHVIYIIASNGILVATSIIYQDVHWQIFSLKTDGSTFFSIGNSFHWRNVNLKVTVFQYQISIHLAFLPQSVSYHPSPNKQRRLPHKPWGFQLGFYKVVWDDTIAERITKYYARVLQTVRQGRNLLQLSPSSHFVSVGNNCCCELECIIQFSSHHSFTFVVILMI